jgi:hypothetical protein
VILRLSDDMLKDMRARASTILALINVEGASDLGTTIELAVANPLAFRRADYTNIATGALGPKRACGG